MSTTIARRIRRIGLLPTTFKEVPFTVLVSGPAAPDGTRTEVEEKRIKKVPIRHRETLSEDDIADRRANILAHGLRRREELHKKLKSDRAKHHERIKALRIKK